jgi:hypothetical protein
LNPWIVDVSAGNIPIEFGAVDIDDSAASVLGQNAVNQRANVLIPSLPATIRERARINVRVRLNGQTRHAILQQSCGSP